MDFHLDTLLNLPNAVVDSYSNTLDAIILKLQLINDGINCPNCNKYGSSLPGMLTSACNAQTLAIKPKMTKKSNDNRF